MFRRENENVCRRIRQRSHLKSFSSLSETRFQFNLRYFLPRSPATLEIGTKTVFLIKSVPRRNVCVS